MNRKNCQSKLYKMDQKKLMDESGYLIYLLKAMNSDIRAYFPLPELENEAYGL